MCCSEKEQKPQKKTLKTAGNSKGGMRKDIKVVLLGDKAVGKSSIASRFCFDKVIYN